MKHRSSKTLTDTLKLWMKDNRLTTRWVITSKEWHVRAILVAREFEEKFDAPRESPTVRKGGLKIFLP